MAAPAGIPINLDVARSGVRGGGGGMRDGSALHLWQGEQPANILLMVRYFPRNLIAQTEGLILANNSTLPGNNLVSVNRMPIFLTNSRDPFSFFTAKVI